MDNLLFVLFLLGIFAVVFLANKKNKSVYDKYEASQKTILDKYDQTQKISLESQNILREILAELKKTK